MEEIMKKNLFKIFQIFVLFCISLSANDSPCQEILKLEKTALDRWQNGDVYGFIELSAENISYFDPSLEIRLDGKRVFKAYLGPLFKKFKIYRYEILNPKIYCNGSLGVLCFNLHNYNKDGAVTSKWNSTEVYQKIDGKWKIIHSHWSKTKPKTENKQ